MTTCKLDGFISFAHTLTIEPTGFDAWGASRWRYQLLAGDEVIFAGDDLTSPPRTTEDEAAVGALAFLTLREHDVEADYFTEHAYTPAQLEWRDAWAEDLSLAMYADDGSEVRSLARYRAD